MRFYRLFAPVLAALLLFSGCTGGNTNIEPSELNDQLAEKFEVTGLLSLSEDLIEERYGLDSDDLESWDIRESETEPVLIAVVKVKEKDDVSEEEAALLKGAKAFAARFEPSPDLVTAVSGTYLFAAAGTDAEHMMKEFEKLTR